MYSKYTEAEGFLMKEFNIGYYHIYMGQDIIDKRNIQSN